jgi:hypothetical protein
MALTDQQKADCRRWMGYPAVGANHATDASRDFSYGWTLPGTWETLTSILDNLRPENEATLVNVYLTNLATLEAAIYGASANLDTASAGPWTWNRNEVGDRVGLYNKCRREMCAFLGLPPGPGLAQNNQIVRG